VATNIKLPVVMVEVFIASENVAETEAFTDTPVAASVGEVELTVGGVESAVAPVVKLQVLFAAKALPAASCAPVVIVAVYCVLGERAALGVNVAVLVESATVPLTLAPPEVATNVKLPVVMVEAFIASEKVADTAVFTDTPVAASAGEVEVTVGGVVSGKPVVKLQVLFAAKALPAASCAPVVIVAVYSVLAARSAFGANVAVLPERETAPVTAAPPDVVTSVNVDVVMVEVFNASENVAEIDEFNAMSVALAVGLVDVTVGAVVSAAGGEFELDPPPPHAVSASIATNMIIFSINLSCIVTPSLTIIF
jgi:hypothetical protein